MSRWPDVRVLSRHQGDRTHNGRTRIDLSGFAAAPPPAGPPLPAGAAICHSPLRTQPDGVSNDSTTSGSVAPPSPLVASIKLASKALTVPPFGHLGGGGNHGPATESLNTWIKGAAARGEVDRVVDIHPGLACGPQQVLCEPYRRFGKDMVHWNEAGHEVVAETLFTSVFSDCE